MTQFRRIFFFFFFLFLDDDLSNFRLTGSRKSIETDVNLRPNFHASSTITDNNAGMK